MKNIIIIGQPRCGKTTLANMLYDKVKCQIIHGDCERTSLDVVFPELNIRTNPKLNKYLIDLMRTQQRDNKYLYSIVLESTDITPLDLFKYFNLENYIIVCLGVTLLDYKEFSKNIIKNDTTLDWTSKESKEDIEKYCKEYIDVSKKYKEDCKKYNINFIDTSINRITTLNNLLLDIINELNKKN